MDTLEDKERSDRILEALRTPSKLPIIKSFDKYKNKDLDSNNFLVNYLANKEIYHQKDLTKEDSKNLEDLVNLGILTVHQTYGNKIFIQLTDFGLKCLRLIDKKYNKNKEHIKTHNFEIIIPIIFIITSITFTIIFALTTLYTGAKIFIILSALEELLTIIFAPRHVIYKNDIRNYIHFTESDYLKLIHKYVPRHQRNIYRNYLAKINGNISDDNK